MKKFFENVGKVETSTWSIIVCLMMVAEVALGFIALIMIYDYADLAFVMIGVIICIIAITMCAIEGSMNNK